MTKKKKILIICLSAAAVVLILAAVAVAMYFFVPAKLVAAGDTDVKAEVFLPYSDEGCDAGYLWFDLSSKVKCTSDVDTDTLGDYTVEYSLDFHGKTYSASRKVTVVDSTAPDIILEGGDVIASAMHLYREPGYTAEDNYDGDLTDNVTVSVGDEVNDICIITYTVTDSSGNTASVEREVTIKDIVAPVLTLEGEAGMTTSDAVFKEPGFHADDDLDGDITDKVVVETDYKEKAEGTFTFTYTVSDAANNKASATRTLTVKDTEGPVMNLVGRAVMYLCQGDAYSEQGCSAIDSFSGDVSASLAISGAPDTSTPGTYTVSYSASDTAGNVSYASRTVKVFAKPMPVEGAINGAGIVSDSTVYLTFDDGPSSNVTPRILDTLKANNVKATFFIINYSNDNKWLIQRMINEGHTVGIHGYSHDYGAIYSSIDAFLDNVERLHRRLIDDFGYDTNLIRFPGGSSNLVSRAYSPGIMSNLCPLVESMGYRYFDWNVSSGDAAGGYVSAAAILGNVNSGLRHGRGNVVLMHDMGAKGTTADALQSIIDFGYNNGYTFAALSSYTNGAHHNIQN